MAGGGWVRWAALAALGAAILAGLIWLSEAVFGLTDRDDSIRLVYGGLLLLFLGGAFALHWRRRPLLILGQMLAWAGIGAVIVLGYSFRFEFARLGDRLMGEILPDRGVSSGPDTVSFRAGRNGHFVVTGLVDDKPVKFLVDTGASLVVLSPDDAARVGIDLRRLNFSMRFATANGVGLGAMVRLRAVTVGPITVRDVRAAVNQAPMRESLLGNSFLERLSGYDVRSGTLTLHR